MTRISRLVILALCAFQFAPALLRARPKLS